MTNSADSISWNLDLARRFQQTVREVSSIFGRLVYLASLRDPGCGRYSHQLFRQPFDLDGGHELIQAAHRAVFDSWLKLGLEDRVEDYKAFLDSRAGVHYHTCFNDAIPGVALPVEQKFFMDEMALVVEVLQLR